MGDSRDAADSVSSGHMENSPMTDLAEHWNQIFASKADKELGWYEGDVRQTLVFLDRITGTPT